MPKTRKLAELEVLEGGGAGGMGGGRMSMPGIVEKQAKKKGTDFVDEMIAADKKLSMKRELEMIKNPKLNPARREAERNATTSMQDGVKTTSYPYAGVNEYKHGGAVSASKRADGIAQRGKTRGKMC